MVGTEYRGKFQDNQTNKDVKVKITLQLARKPTQEKKRLVLERLHEAQLVEMGTFKKRDTQKM